MLPFNISQKLGKLNKKLDDKGVVSPEVLQHL